MKIGVVFPQTEFGSDPAAIKAYAQTAEALGYSHILAYEHVLGANPDRPGGWQGPYTHEHPFHDPFVLFSYMAAVTEQIEFITGILILPQRETAVVAKQVATLDLLSSGRFRLGIGVGWNKVEYVALNQDFHSRGRRLDEQLEVLQQLWQQPLVDYHGNWHTIPDAGLNPRPQRPIPLWFGGHADVVLQRVARLGAGWLPNFRQADAAHRSLAKLDQYLAENGRARSDIGLEPRLHYGQANADEWQTTLDGWRKAGATHITLNTMSCGFDTPEKHVEAIRYFMETMREA
ncbi:MAG: LLM class F420-dependent oxidoreductase [Chloroflexota bacterium]